MNEFATRLKAIGGRLGDWLDDRTGFKELAHEALYENIPGGSRWIYVTGSMLVFAFVTQAVTGIFLWMCYSPGSQNAWESVYYITNEMRGGSLLRGVHHYMAQMMIVLLPLHLLQVVLCRAYTAPREINYWLGLVLMQIVLGLGLTGYLLPWDQKGYWATKVATELMSLPPGGGIIQKVVVGGSDYGHATLTRFFAMHAGVLPAVLIGVLVLHVAMFRKHGITAHSSENRDDEHFWPKQVFKDAAACALMLFAVVLLSIFRDAELGPPAEPTESYGAARPEWYFLFLFQLLKHFEENEFLGAIVIPGLVMLFLFALPLIAKVRYGHMMNCAAILVLLIGAGYLTYEAIDHDSYNTRDVASKPTEKNAKLLWEERYEAAEKFHAAKEQAEHEYERMKELIDFYGIPKDGALRLVAVDPEIQGPRLFVQKCASCHSYLDSSGHGLAGPKVPEDWDQQTPFGGPNLYGFASRHWITKLLNPEEIVGPHYFGYTAHGIPDEAGDYSSDMVNFVRDELEQSDVKAIAAALSAEAGLISQREVDQDVELLKQGQQLLVDNCATCHKYGGENGEAAPDLDDYGSAEWLRAFIANPDHDRFYMGNNDRMPAFAENEEDPSANLLTAHQIDMLVRWLRGGDKDLKLKLEVEAEQSRQPEVEMEIADEPEPAEEATKAPPNDEPSDQ
jgi:ubiquinol-cytochrome c reductase cytochrome b subunit